MWKLETKPLLYEYYSNLSSVHYKSLPNILKQCLLGELKAESIRAQKLTTC